MDTTLADSFAEGRLLSQIFALARRFACRLTDADEAEDIAQIVALYYSSELCAGRLRIDTTLEALIRPMVTTRHASIRLSAKRRKQRCEHFVTNRLACPPV